MDVVDRSSMVLPGAVELTVEPGEILLLEGEADDSIFEVVDGTFEILRGDDLERIATVGPGETLGEIAALAQCPRTATVRAVAPSVVRRVDRRTYGEWLAADDDRLTELTELVRSRIDRQRAIALTSELLAVDGGVAADVVELADWVHLEPGDVAVRRGRRRPTPATSSSAVASPSRAARAPRRRGRSRRGRRRDRPDRADRRDRRPWSPCARPRLRPLRRRRLPQPRRRPPGADAAAVAHDPGPASADRRNLTDRARSIAVGRHRATRHAADDHRARQGARPARHDARHLWAARIDAALGRPGLVESGHDVARAGAVRVHPGRRDRATTTSCWRPTAHDSRWTRRALALADRIVVVMSANPHDDELRRVGAILAAAPSQHPGRALAGAGPPDGRRAAEWHRSPRRPLRLRPGRPPARAVRSPTSADSPGWCPATRTGLVLGGGGARGFAHLGVWRALVELGVDVDAIGGAVDRRAARRRHGAADRHRRPRPAWPPSCSTTCSTTRCRSSR